MRRSGVLFFLALIVAGCSSAGSGSSGTTRPKTSSSSAAPSSTSSSTASPANLQSMLLTISDMPTGWNVSNTAQPTGGDCGQDILQAHHPTSLASARFVQGGTTPLLEEELATYSSADQGFAQIKSSLDACHNFNLQSTSGQPVPANMGAMSYPSRVTRVSRTP